MKEVFMRSIKSNDLKLKIITFSVLLTILPVLVVGIVSYRKSYSVMLEATIENSKQLANQMAQSTELTFYEIEKFLSIRQNANTIRFLLSKSKDERTQYTFRLLDMIDTYHDNYRFSDSVKDILIVGVSDNHFSERRGIRSFTDAERDTYVEMFSHPDGAMLVFLLDKYDGVSDLRVLIGAPVYQVATNDVLGVVVVEMDTEPFISFTENMRIGSDGYYLIEDQNGVFFNENGIVDVHDLSAGELDEIRNNESGFIEHGSGADRELIFFSTINEYQWKIVGRVRVEDIMSEIRGIKSYSYFIIFFCAIASALLNIWVIRWLFVPLDKLKNKMRSAAHGNLDVALTHRSNDEIAQLNDTFNHMMSQIKYLMQKSLEEQEELKKSQLRVLQAQINPHFLYNTLDTIIWLINGHENDKAMEMVESLSKFFRASLSNGKDFISVSEELEHVSNYLAIQKSRNGGILDYSIDVNDDILDDIVMKLILQPIVENAIYHGLKPKGGGKIWIKGWRDDADLVFTIRDDGAGMTEECLKQLQELLDGETPAPERSGYGLYNVQRRIRLFYSERYGLTLNSWDGEGTIVTLRVRGIKHE